MKYKDKIYKNIREYCSSHYTLLDSKDFILGDILFNRRCHLNAVQKIREGKAKQILLCVAWDKDDKEPCIHFINTTEDGKFQDNTWGWFYERNEYYLIKKIEEKEYDTIWNILSDAKKSIFKLNSSGFRNFIHRLDKNII